MASLGVNIDHIANVRQARLASEPEPVQMAFLAELGGADGITVHLREDRRHIQDKDLKLLRATINTRLNLEMAATKEMVEIALQVKPDMVTIVPESREEITTEGGLEVVNNKEKLREIINNLHSAKIQTSIFIDPIEAQIKASKEIGAGWVEIHTGCYANASWEKQEIELAKIKASCAQARSMGLHVNAGHGLTYLNVEPIAAIEGIEELNIGHTIVARALAVGLQNAVKEMKSLVTNPRRNNF
ncbi:pyridoxine 5'-phosphate synthase [Prochlorococcus marinus]|uniref:Pyridoxine 5'-phosphate synthase n=1 Tax=Prochlorococcus marinus (strain MIT 9211) TaxID=93059 RepID=PDXJ_PROM4|nr:pyridoxine 5'-phosphate synthase [Prochlorococcus marinus]A9BAZ9.1 RecName: Full=Pyridoxine 5'-phosphate synthase; Short=PNP synthase [Prochlorococcus marinus str. MIT 9211]ABX09011.1 Pyridoxal phosphate biosynthetic protein PdxJ [Prochlorococcus marinus str. MIT 9211]